MSNDPGERAPTGAGALVVERLEDDGSIPNNPLCPLVAYRGAVRLSGADPAAIFERLFESNGWTGCWRNGILAVLHFHSTAHEVLGVYSGTATVRLGGDSGVTLDIEPGDVLVIPAGVGHQRLASRGTLGIVGAYPEGQSPDLCRGDGTAHDAQRSRVAAVPLPTRDPVYGAGGPLLSRWGPRDR